MARFTSCALATLVALGLTVPPAHGQAVVESAIVTGATGSAAAGAKGAGSASAGVFGALRKTLDGANKPGTVARSVRSTEPASSSTTAVRLDPPSAEALAAVQPKDVNGITVGLTREELIEKYGLPALKTSKSTPDGQVETYTYMQSKSDSVVVTLKDGVVSEKTGSPGPRKQLSSVFTLP